MLFLGCSFASIDAPASATITLQPGAPAVSSNDTGGETWGHNRRVVDETATGQFHWSWLIIAALVGFAPLAIERVYRKKSSRRRYSRMDITMLETELDELKAQNRHNRAILDSLYSLSEGIEINDAEGRRLYSNSKYRELFPEAGELHFGGADQIDQSSTKSDQDGPGSLNLAEHEVKLPDGRSVSIRRLENRSGESVLLYTDLSDHDTVAPAAYADGGSVSDGISPLPPGVGPDGQRLRVFLAEDNAIYQKVIHDFLTRAGHFVEIVENGELVVCEVQRNTYDVVLIDFQMLGMDGVAATRAIRQLDGDVARIPIIALTTDETFLDKEEYRSMGADGYVSKPIEPVELFGAIGQCCGTEVDRQPQSDGQ
jgi:CheY-like chemotaxis protein